MASSLSPLLACPRCDKALDPIEAGYRCPACKVDFPLVGGIPWLFADPATALGEWRGRLNFALEKMKHEVAGFTEAFKDKALLETTRGRLERLRTVTEDHAARLSRLLEPMQLEAFEATYETHLALRTRLPVDQGLTTYYANIHRDWAWGEEENEASSSLVLDALDGASPGKTLIHGAGAARLAYDFHMRAAPELTVAMDFNPLLLLVAASVTRGDSLELYEFPIAPANLDDVAVLRELQTPAPARDEFFLVLGDALRPPFPERSFQTILTPWLVDIIQDDFATLARRVNRLLAPGGHWINFGSLAFGNSDPALRYSLEECLALLEQSGFKKTRLVEETIPYMCSPASRHARRERVVTWTAVKTKNAKRPPRAQSLPDWLVKGNEPIPLLPSFQTQALTTRVYAFIMSLIGGRRSLKDIATLMVEQQLLAEAEAEPTLRSFLIRMYDDSQRPTGY